MNGFSEDRVELCGSGKFFGIVPVMELAGLWY